MTKLTKKETEYSVGHVGSHCGKVFEDDKGHCKHFQGTGPTGTCTKVEGSINAVYWCTEWQKAK